MSFGLYIALSGGEPRLYRGSHFVLADRERTRVLDLPPLLDIGVQCTTMLAIVSGLLALVYFLRLALFSKSMTKEELRRGQEYLWSPAIPIVSVLIILVFVSLGVANRHFGEWQAWAMIRP